MEFEEEQEERNSKVLHPTAKPNPSKDFYPICIVWSPIPCLTWLFPFIGHLGVSTSRGIIHDFIGPYTINKSPTSTGFGPVTRYLPVKLEELSIDKQEDPIAIWDKAVERTSGAFEHMMHNLFCNNCHSHVAGALNELHYREFDQWNTLFLILLLFFKGKFVSKGRTIYTFAPFVILCFTMFFFLVVVASLAQQ